MTDLSSVDAVRNQFLEDWRPGASKDLGPRVDLVQFSTVVPQAIEWLWPDWLPAGKLTILAGDGGTGKTTLAIALAATVSTGGQWPDGTSCKAPGNVLIWSGEDDPADTLAPRLIAAGADTKRCYYIGGMLENGEKRAFDPGNDMAMLAERIQQIGGAALLIVDPIVSAVSGDINKANDVRRSLQSLVDLGTANGCAVLGITHFTKGSGASSPLHRVTGSQAFGALARMVLVTGKREDTSERVMTRAKSNIAQDGGGIAYSIDVGAIAGGIMASRAIWGEVVDGSAREILGDMEYREEDEDRDDAEQFIRGLLADGPMYANDVERDVRAVGFNMSKIRRVAKKIGVDMQKDKQFKGRWRWALDAHTFQNQP